MDNLIFTLSKSITKYISFIESINNVKKAIRLRKDNQDGRTIISNRRTMMVALKTYLNIGSRRLHVLNWS
jgi:hypothetical protein